jgi:hypothetical protein
MLSVTGPAVHEFATKAREACDDLAVFWLI